MLRRLLPVNLVDPGDSASDFFVSFLDFTELFSSATEGSKQLLMPSSQGIIPFLFSNNYPMLLAIAADKRLRIMYVCGMVAADFSNRALSLTDGQPRFLQPTPYYKDYITITYVLNPKSLKP